MRATDEKEREKEGRDPGGAAADIDTGGCCRRCVALQMPGPITHS
jgi:hypothetical protein